MKLKKRVIGGEQICERERAVQRQNETEGEANGRKAAIRECVTEKIQNETVEESKARRVNMWMEECLWQETEEQCNRRWNENIGAIRNAQNRIHRVNNLLFTEANYQQHNSGG